jgi:hypothetical protein
VGGTHSTFCERKKLQNSGDWTLQVLTCSRPRLRWEWRPSQLVVWEFGSTRANGPAAMDRAADYVALREMLRMRGTRPMPRTSVTKVSFCAK